MSDDTAEAPVVRFITDKPADEDSFVTHSVLARAISEAIKSNQQLKIIGLLGRWGSGKSTVIQYLTKLIEGPGKPEFRVFSYDAWLHQGDPPRRSFLESLVGMLSAVNLIDGEAWKNPLKFLAGTLQQNDTVETPILTRDAKTMALLLLPVPFALSLISVDTIAGTFGPVTSQAATWSFVVAIAFIVLPLLYWVIRRDYLITVEMTPTEWFPPLFINKELSRRSTLIERSPDPDSFEFGKKFQELLLEVYEKNTRLIIIIDNIDRIGHEEALNLWANIRSFFLGLHRSSTVEYEPFHPVVILPVDDHAIRRLFDNRYGEGDAADSFLNKTFDAVFAVTDPVMSDWRDFLTKQFRHALPNSINDPQIFIVRRFLEEKLKDEVRLGITKTPKPLTPRDINKLINSVSALYLQWWDRGVDVVSISYFVIFKSSIEKDVLDFILTGKNALAAVDGDWQSKIAALHYGVGRDKAAQVVLEEPLRAAIQEMNVVKFQEYSKIPGFGEVFEDLSIFNGIRDEGTGWFYLNAACLLSGIGEFKSELWAELAWENLGKSVNGTLSKLPIGEELNSCLGAALPFFEADAVAQIGVRVGQMIAEGLSGIRSDVDHEDIVILALTLLTERERTGVDLPKMPIETSVLSFLHILGSFRDAPALLDRLVFDEEEEEAADVGEALVALAQDEAAAASLPFLVDFLADAGQRASTNMSEPNWSPLIDYIAQAVGDPQSPLSAQNIILPLISHVTPVAPDWSRIHQIIDQGHVALRLNEALASNELESVAAGYALLIWRNAALPLGSGVTWRSYLQGHSEIVGMVETELRRVCKNTTLDPLADSFADHRASRELITAIISRQIENGDLGLIDVGRVTNNFSRYHYMFSYRLDDRFVDLLLGYEDSEASLKTAPWGEGIKALADRLVQQGAQKADEVRSIIKERLSNSPSDSLLPALTEGDEPFSLISQFQSQGAFNFLESSGPVTTLREFIPKLISADADVVTRWFELLKSVNQVSRVALVAELASAILNAGQSKALFDLLLASNNSLLKSKTFTSRPEEAVVKVLMPALRTKVGRKLLLQSKNIVGKWIKASSTKNKEDLKKRMKSFRQSAYRDRVEFARRVTAAWGLR